MVTKVKDSSFGILGRWFIATLIGWVVGIIAAIVLSYAIVGLFFSESSNLIVGLVLGAVVALAQMISVRRILPLTWRWVWGAAVGMGIPFIAAVVIDEIWFDAAEGSDMGLVLVGAVGGALAGLIQARVLKPHTNQAQWWILASLVSWGLAELTSVAFGEVGILVGGIVLGGVSGVLLIWMLRYTPEQN